MHRAALAAAAVTYCGFSLLFLSDHIDDDCRDNSDQHNADDDRPDITYKPLQHFLSSFWSVLWIPCRALRA